MSKNVSSDGLVADVFTSHRPEVTEGFQNHDWLLLMPNKIVKNEGAWLVVDLVLQTCALDILPRCIALSKSLEYWQYREGKTVSIQMSQLALCFSARGRRQQGFRGQGQRCEP